MAVSVYRSTDANAPVMTSTLGSLITVLTACLVNGYGQVTLTSLTRVGNTAFAVYSGGHGFTTGSRVLISGAAQADYNVTEYVTVTSPTEFNYPVANTPVTPATGTVTAIRAPAGWTRPFVNGSTGAVYRQGAGSNGFYLNVDDSVAGSYAYVRAFETATAFSGQAAPFNGINALPTEAIQQGGYYWWKNDAITRAWIIIATAKGFHFMTDYGGYWIGLSLRSLSSTGYYFGDLVDTNAGDVYATVLTGAATQNYTQSWQDGYEGGSVQSTNTQYMMLMRPWHQVGSAVGCNRTSDLMSGRATQFPHPTDGTILLSPVNINEIGRDARGNVIFRGRMPGIWQANHPTTNQPCHDSQRFTVTNGPLAGKVLEMRALQGTPLFYEISNTY